MRPRPKEITVRGTVVSNPALRSGQNESIMRRDILITSSIVILPRAGLYAWGAVSLFLGVRLFFIDRNTVGD
jgi:hypothetical protein